MRAFNSESGSAWTFMFVGDDEEELFLVLDGFVDFQDGSCRRYFDLGTGEIGHFCKGSPMDKCSRRLA